MHKQIKNAKVLAVIELVMYLLLIAFAALYIYLEFDFFLFQLKNGSATTHLRIPLVLPYGTMLIGFVCVIIHSVGKIMRLVVMRNDLESIFNKEVNIEDMR